MRYQRPSIHTLDIPAGPTGDAAPAGSTSTLTPQENALLQTVIYASLFAFPLTPDEVSFAALECDLSVSSTRETYRRSPRLQRVLEFSDGYFFPRGKRSWIRLRRWRRRHALRCLAQNSEILKLIAGLPGVRLAAVSGSAAHLNVGRQGDIDLFIVTRGPRVWSVAVMALLLAKLLRRRRMICLNYLISERKLVLDQPDLFTANQLVHLQPIQGLATFRLLLELNSFVARFYPRAHGLAPAECEWVRDLRPPLPLLRIKQPLEWLLSSALGRPVEWACRVLYRWHLRRRAGSWQSPGQVRLEDQVLKLHTESHRQEVLRRFEEELARARRRIESTKS